MSLPLYDSCCGFISLRISTLVYGYLHLIVSWLGIIFALFLMSMGVVSDDFKNKYSIFYEAYNMTEEEFTIVDSIVIVVIGAILFCLFAIKFVFVIFLLIGGYKGKSEFIKAYLVYSAIMMTIAFKLMIVIVIQTSFSVIIVYITSYALELYFLLVVRSYMIKLKEDSKGDKASEIYKSKILY